MGDLTRRKLVPAPYKMYKKDRPPQGTRVVAFAQGPCSPDEFRGPAREGARVHYVTGDFSVPEHYGSF